MRKLPLSLWAFMVNADQQKRGYYLHPLFQGSTRYIARRRGTNKQWRRSLFRCSTDHIRSYNVKSHWKVQGRNFTHEKASNRLQRMPWCINKNLGECNWLSIKAAYCHWQKTAQLVWADSIDQVIDPCHFKALRSCLILHVVTRQLLQFSASVVMLSLCIMSLWFGSRKSQDLILL